MTVLRSGPTKGYSDNWAKAFGKTKRAGKAKPKASASKKKASPKKKSKKS